LLGAVRGNSAAFSTLLPPTSSTTSCAWHLVACSLTAPTQLTPPPRLLPLSPRRCLISAGGDGDGRGQRGGSSQLRRGGGGAEKTWKSARSVLRMHVASPSPPGGGGGGGMGSTDDEKEDRADGAAVAADCAAAEPRADPAAAVVVAVAAVELSGGAAAAAATAERYVPGGGGTYSPWTGGGSLAVAMASPRRRAARVMSISERVRARSLHDNMCTLTLPSEQRQPLIVGDGAAREWRITGDQVALVGGPSDSHS
jgi:hypothetical protein